MPELEVDIPRVMVDIDIMITMTVIANTLIKDLDINNAQYLHIDLKEVEGVMITDVQIVAEKFLEAARALTLEVEVEVLAALEIIPPILGLLILHILLLIHLFIRTEVFQDPEALIDIDTRILIVEEVAVDTTVIRDLVLHILAPGAEKTVAIHERDINIYLLYVNIDLHL